ncbi:MAG: DUF1653 domain-containing protein [Rhodanobacter sp.]|nr:MAG: DUF1653 domain-containing protein [Rhodanobacter sp.]TAM05516.1 MAG: DUF1653 domain-containing protein [Rhodanobacter sp.]TAM43160.1 MAG: DUF1653 domain-containing protein [Rhodanobacter sp.]TAN26370.1 MAG: DUF1653 domain-containing protein [Rhodanobacter sp.]
MQPAAGIYRHYKGQRYRVLGTARHSETLEPLVVYQALYGEHGLWVRPAAMFCESIELDGKPVARFALEQAQAEPTRSHPHANPTLSPESNP